MSIQKWPRLERPREKLLHYGSQQLSDAELLAILFSTGSPGQDALTLARNLLAELGDIKRLLDSPLTILQQYKGIGVSKFANLQAALELARRYFRQELIAGPVLTTAIATQQYLQAELSHYQHEVIGCLFLDTQQRVREFEVLAHGTIDSAYIHPREVAKRALHHNAAALILAHNHPSGNPTPSQADIDLTTMLKHALSLIDIQLYDHILVLPGKTISLAMQGLI